MLIDALIEFIRTHPLSVDGAHLHPLANRTGLRYDYAVIRPLWDKDEVVLRLEKYLENWSELNPDDFEYMGVSAGRIVLRGRVPDIGRQAARDTRGFALRAYPRGLRGRRGIELTRLR